jgi:hypothetical protein
MQRPDQSVYAQQLEEHRLKQQREAEMAHETEAPVHQAAEAAPAPAPAPRMEEAVHAEAQRPEIKHEEAPREQAPKVEAPRYEAPKVDAKEILSTAGLQMVETDRSKAVQTAYEPEPVQLGRPKREKPVVQPASDELVQVETRNK